METAAKRLADVYSTPSLGGGIDLSRVCVVTPGRRLGRLLLARMAELAAAESRWFSPPRMVTPVQIADVVLGMSNRPLASATQRVLAWKKALDLSDAADAARVIGPRAEGVHGGTALDDGRWLDDTVSSLARALVLPAEVPQCCAAVSARGEHERWEALDRLRERYERLLRDAGLADARLEHLRRLRSSEPATIAADAPHAIVLIGVLELDQAARRALQLFRDHAPANTAAASRVRVISPSEVNGLDEWGAIPLSSPADDGAPRDERINLDDRSILWAADPTHAAHLTIDTIAALQDAGSLRTPRDATVCSPDASFTRELAIESAAVPGFSVHDAAGVSLASTGVGRLAHALSRYLRQRDRLTLADLCKHGHAQRALSAAGFGNEHPDWIVQLDEAAAASPRAPIDTDDGVSGAVARTLHGLLELAPDDPARPLEQQAVRLGRMLGVLLQACEDTDSIDALAAALHELGDCATLTGPVTLRDAADLLLEIQQGIERAPDPSPGAIEVLGWLDAAFDPAPNLILLGFNAGVTPDRPGPGAWLNQTVMRALGMFTAEHAAARDACLLRHMLATRAGIGSVHAVVARADAEGSALWPSPFVFACDDDTAIRRAERAASHELSSGPIHAARLRPAPATPPDAFPIAPVVDKPMPDAVSVTAFRDYIRSPYAFFVRHVIKAEEASEPGREADYRNMGTLVHDVLRDFARGPEATSADAARIVSWLLDRAQEKLRSWPSYLVTSTRGMQQQTLIRRLRRFAQIQAAHRAEGWMIEHTEWEPPTPVTLKTPAGTLSLRGRIDRIDRRDDEVMIVDYKLSDALKDARDAFKAGRKNQDPEWLDLQLPLYRHMLLRGGVLATRWHLVYWSLCADKHTPRLVRIEAGEEHLRHAEELAARLAEQMLRGKWSPLGDPYDAGGALSRLCGLRLLDPEEADA